MLAQKVSLIKTCTLPLMFALLLLPLNLIAKVVDSAPGGFVLKVERQVDVAPSVAYQHFSQINKWWIADHTYFGKSQNLSLELSAGGCFCEIEGDKQVMHMMVSYVEPDKEVRMVGGLGPLQMMGVNGGMSWKFESLKNGKTKITHQYQVSGWSAGGLDKLAPIVDKVQTMQVDALVNSLNTL